MADDRFAQIASEYRVDQNRGLIVPAPEPLTDSVFLLGSGTEGVFEPVGKMSTREEMEAALKELRKQYQPFLQDFAPALEPCYRQIDLKHFHWTLDGVSRGEVTVPHYGPEVGKHTASYETAFILPQYDPAEESVILVCRGVDYIAEVFVNGRFAGRHEGLFAPFELDVTELVHSGENALKIDVKNDFPMTGNACNEGEPVDGDKIYAATGPGWDDPLSGWHHCPAGMGIYQKVYLQIRKKDYLTDLFVREGRELWIECMGRDPEEKSVAFDISIYGQNFHQTVFEHRIEEPFSFVEAGVGDTLTEAKLAAQGKLHQPEALRLGNGFNRFKFPISIPEPRLWSPDEPNLYQVQVRMLVDGKETSSMSRQFGIRSFTQDTEREPKGMFYLNGSPIRLRGANTMGYEQQCVMQENWEQLLDDMLLAKLCNMNFLRLTQRPVQEEIYALCDRVGLMIQTDLPLFGTVRINQTAEVIRQAGEMEHLIRSHPCCILVTYINEPFPNAHNKPHRMILRNEMTAMFTAADTMIRLHNPDRVIKHVDGDYDPPCESMPDNHCYTMWYNGHGIEMGKLHKGYWLEVKPGWCWGCGEFGAEGLDPVDLMKRRYPEEWISEPFHPSHILDSQTGSFYHFFFDKADSMEGWVQKSQEYQAFATKIMTNALRRSNLAVSFAIHLFIDAWPAGWMKAIMDCERTPKPAWFVYRDCLSPLKADLRSDRFTWYGQETLRVESRICNDREAILGARILYMAKMGDEILASSVYPAKISTCRTDYQGTVEIPLPDVHERSRITLYMAVEKDGAILHWTSETYSVFPKKNYQMPEITSLEEYQARREEYDTLVQGGKILLLAPLEPGNWQICGRSVEVKACGMHPVYFVSGKTGHRLTEGFREGDFAYWYDSHEDRLMPISDTTLQAEGAEPVLLSGNQKEEGIWDEAPVCAVLSIGDGKLILCQADLGRGDCNPVCAEFADRIARMQSQAESV